MKLKYSSKPDKLFVKSQLKKGADVEMEHTYSRRIAKTIAKAHLIETGKKNKSGKISSEYYDELDKLEKKLKRKKR